MVHKRNHEIFAPPFPHCCLKNYALGWFSPAAEAVVLAAAEAVVLATAEAVVLATAEAVVLATAEAVVLATAEAVVLATPHCCYSIERPSVVVSGSVLDPDPQLQI